MMQNKESKKKLRPLLIEPDSADDTALQHSECRLFCGQPLVPAADKTMHAPSNFARQPSADATKQAINVIHAAANGKTVKSRQQAESKRLVSLLTFLFGSMLIVCLLVTNQAQVAASNSTLTTTKISNSTTARPTTTTTPEIEVTKSTTSESDVTTVAALDEVSAEVSEAASAEDEESDEPSTGGSRSLDRKLLLESASDAADHLLARMKPTSDDRSVESAEDESATDSQSGGENATAAPLDVDDTNADRRTAAALTGGNNNITAPTTPEQAQLKHAFEIYAKWRAAGDDIIELFSRKMLPVIVEHDYDVDSVTVTGLLQVFNGIRAIKPWALKLLDASAKISPGLLVGTQSDFGDFDECLNIREDDPSGLGTELAEIDEATGLKSSTLIGRYCLADVEFPKPPRVRLAERNEELQTDYAPIELRRPLLNFSETADFKGTVFVETANFFHMLYVDPIRVGLCLTNKIDPDSFAKVFNQLVKEFGVSINFRDRCVTKYDRPIWTTKQKVSAYILLVACSLVLICTALDLLHSKLNKWPLPRSLDFWKKNLQRTLQKHRPLFTSFSIIRNTKRLFKAQQPPAARFAGGQSNNRGSNVLTIGADNKHCTLACSAGSSSSTESSPSIERRGGSSPAGSAMNLINGTSSSELSGSSGSVGGHRHHQFGDAVKTNHLLTQFTNHQHNQSVKVAGDHHHQEQKIIDGSRHQQPVATRAAGAELNLVCLHGIRVITMTWMIVNHTYLFGGFFVLWAHRRLIDIAEWPKSLSFQLVLNGWLTVETYFFLSATIIVLNVLPLLKVRKFSYPAYIFHRLVRLIPAYVGLVALNFLWPLISSGPVWLVKGKSFIQDPCENYLWTNFLFINNWIWPEKQCMVHTWFLSADFQLYLLAPILVYLLYRRPVLGHSMNIIVAILASVFSGFVIYANKLMPTTLINKLEFDSIKQQLSYSYFATYQHMGPYCLGIFIGYLLYKRPNVKLPSHLTWLLWLLLPPLSFTTILLTYLWNGAYDDPNLINPSPLVSALYVAIHRTIWTSLLAWIVFACATGRAKLMSNFLSHSMFIPLSRLSFSIYLVHLPVIMFRALNLRHTIEWTDSNILWEACGNFIASIVIGYFVNVTFESPIINLEQVIFGRPGERAKAKLSQQQSAGIIGRSGNMHLMAAGNKLRSNSLMPQLISVSKTSSDNDLSDDNKSDANSSDRDGVKQQLQSLNQHDDQTSVICETGQTIATDTISDGFTTPTTEGSTQIAYHQRPLTWNSRNSIVSFRAPKTSVGVHQREPLAPPTPRDNAPPSTGSSPDQVVEQQMAPASGKPPRKFLSRNQHEPSSDDSIGSTIYPISVSEYQNIYPPRHASSFGTSLRQTQYATLARTSRFMHDESGAPVDRLELQRKLYHPSKSRSHLGDSISAHNQDAALNQLKSPKHAVNYRQGQLLSRRQSRYNTLTGLGSREWRQDYAATSLARLDLNGQQQDWQGSSGWMIPRVDSTTLRRQPKRNEASATTTAGSIIEEHEDASL